VDAVEATAVAVAHVSHVDLAPMKVSGNLQALDPSYNLGGASLGGAGKLASMDNALGAKGGGSGASSKDRGDEWKMEAKRNAFGGDDEMQFDRAESKREDGGRDGGRDRKHSSKQDDDVQVMKF